MTDQMVMLPWLERRKSWVLYDTGHLLMAIIDLRADGWVWQVERKYGLLGNYDTISTGATSDLQGAKEEVEDILRAYGHTFLPEKLVCML